MDDQKLIKTMAFGIDQSQTGCGVSCIRVKDGYCYGTATFVADKELWPNDDQRLYQMVRKMRAWMDPMMFNHGSLGHADVIVCLENHGFQQFGKAHLNLELAGQLKYWFQDAWCLEPGYTLHTVLPNVWQSWGKVKKPKKEMKKVRRKGESDDEFSARKPGTKLDVDKYVAMYPGYGQNENEIDASFIGLYGVKLWAEKYNARQSD